MKPSPIPILVKHCGVKISTLGRVLPKVYGHLSTLHNLAKAPVVKPKTHQAVAMLALMNWGTHPDPKVRKQLWDCYFPGKRPHIWHVLYFMLELPMSKLVEKSGISERAIRKYLTRSRVPQRHVRAIARFAMEYRDAMASNKSKAGRDPRYMILHRALHDRKRMTTHEDIDED